MKVCLGDLVQWQSQGSFQFMEAKAVTSMDKAPDGTDFVFVEGATMGIPMDQIVIIERGRSYYGNWIVGCWLCDSCTGYYYPRELWERHLETPFICPNCSGKLIYDEFE